MCLAFELSRGGPHVGKSGKVEGLAFTLRGAVVFLWFMVSKATLMGWAARSVSCYCAVWMLRGLLRLRGQALHQVHCVTACHQPCLPIHSLSPSPPSCCGRWMTLIQPPSNYVTFLEQQYDIWFWSGESLWWCDSWVAWRFLLLRVFFQAGILKNCSSFTMVHSLDL